MELEKHESLVERYYQIDETKRNLKETFRTIGDGPNKEMYLSVIESADQELLELIALPEVKDQLHIDYIKSQEELRQIDELAQAVLLGLVQNNIIQERRDQIINNPRYKTQRESLGIMAVASIAEFEETETPEAYLETEQSSETQRKTSVPVVIKSNKLIVNGSNILINLMAPRKRQEINEAKAFERFIEIIADKKSVKISDLWEEVFPGENSSGQVMAYFRDILKKIKFNDEELISHNGKRGLGSGYQVNPKFNLVITHKEDEIIPVPIALNRKSREFSKEEFPFTDVELAVMLEFIRQNRDLIEGLEDFQDEMIDQIVDNIAFSDIEDAINSITAGLNNKKPQLIDLRRNIIDRMKKYIGSQDWTEKALEKLDDEDIRSLVTITFIGSDGDKKLFQLYKNLNREVTVIHKMDKNGCVDEIRLVVNGETIRKA